MFDLKAHLERQQAFSLETFGPGERKASVIAHIRKELSEIEAKPQDVMEYADLLLLCYDGALRAGYAPSTIVELSRCEPHLADIVTVIKHELGWMEARHFYRAWIDVLALAWGLAIQRGFTWYQLTTALQDKLSQNMLRKWPDWRTVPSGQPIEHVRNGAA